MRKVNLCERIYEILSEEVDSSRPINGSYILRNPSRVKRHGRGREICEYWGRGILRDKPLIIPRIEILGCCSAPLQGAQGGRRGREIKFEM